MRPDSLPRLWRYINLLLTYLLNTYLLTYLLISLYNDGMNGLVRNIERAIIRSLDETRSQDVARTADRVASETSN